MNVQNERVTIVVPTFNRCKFLLDTLESCYLKQKHVSEIIIVDDASSDGTEKAILNKNYNNVLYFRNSKHRGLPYSRNIGIDLAKGEYVLFGEDDLYIPAGHIEKLMGELHRHDLDIVAPILLNVTSRDDVFNLTPSSKNNVIDTKRLIGNFDCTLNGTIQVPFVHSCALIKKSVLHKNKYFEGYKGNAFREETDLYLRCYAGGYKIGITDRSIAYHLKNNESRANGCGDNRKFISRIHKHINNLIFIGRNRKTIKKITGKGMVSSCFNFILGSFSN